MLRKKTNRRRRLNRRTRRKTRSRRRERGARVKGVTRTTPAKAFDATKAHVNVLKMSVFLNFFPSALLSLHFRVSNPNSSRKEGGGERGTFSHKKKTKKKKKKKTKRFVFLCPVLDPLVIFFDRFFCFEDIYITTLEDILFFSERCSSSSLSLVTLSRQ